MREQTASVENARVENWEQTSGIENAAWKVELKLYRETALS